MINFSHSDINDASFLASGRSPPSMDDSNYIMPDDGNNTSNQRAFYSKISHQQSSNFYEAIEELHHIPLEVKFQTQTFIRKLEQEIRNKKNLIEKVRQEVKAAAD